MKRHAGQAVAFFLGMVLMFGIGVAGVLIRGITLSVSPRQLHRIIMPQVTTRIAHVWPQITRAVESGVGSTIDQQDARLIDRISINVDGLQLPIPRAMAIPLTHKLNKTVKFNIKNYIQKKLTPDTLLTPPLEQTVSQALFSHPYRIEFMGLKVPLYLKVSP